MANRAIEAKKLKMRKAYLKHRRHSYDPLSDYSLRSRGGKVLDLSSPIPETQTHGKRGLTWARAEGPTAVIKDAYTDDVEDQRKRGAQRSTMIPRAQVAVQVQALVHFEQSAFYQKARHYYHRQVTPRITMWFSGLEFIFSRRDEDSMWWSVVYTKDRAMMLEERPSKIRWQHQVALSKPG